MLADSAIHISDCDRCRELPITFLVAVANTLYFHGTFHPALVRLLATSQNMADQLSCKVPSNEVRLCTWAHYE